MINTLTSMILGRLFIRALLGLIFLYTGISKLRHPYSFRRGIQDYQLIPSTIESALALSSLLAFAIPPAEILAGVGLLSGFLLLPVSLLVSTLLALFSVAILINLLRGRRDISCHCSGGTDTHPISWWLLGRNIILLFGPIVLLVSPTDPFIPDVLMRRPLLIDTSLWTSTVLPAVLLAIAVLSISSLLNYVRILWNN